jgi:hypothetical protein
MLAVPMIKRIPVYPLLFAAYPVLAIQASNLQQIPLIALWRPLLTILLTTAVLLIVVGSLLKDWDKAALSLTLVLLLFFSVGHVIRAVNASALPWTEKQVYLTLLSIWAALLIVGPWWIWRMMSQVTENLRRFINAFAIVVFLFPLAQTLLHVTQPVTASEANGSQLAPSAETAISLQPPEILPDIYYIILDGYGRADILEEIYDYDNSPFLEFLRARGFYVAEKSRTNYVQTRLSLSSSLNLTYLDTVANEQSSRGRQQMIGEIGDSRVVSLLKDAGYKTVAISSGYQATDMEDADVYLTALENPFNDLELLLIENSVVGFITELKPELFHRSHDAHRIRILHAFDVLGANAIDGPKFVYAHIVSPHPPFIFGPEGEWVNPDREYAILDGNDFRGTRSEYVSGYRDQLHFLNQRLQETIDHIIASSAIPPIIIIQGDHGPASLLDWQSAANSCLKERIAILNAYYLPERSTSHLYESISPVNSFRVVFNAYFQANLSLLPDENYFSTLREPFDFVNVTTQIETQCALNKGGQ